MGSDRDSPVGITTRYGLEVPGIESRWRQDFPHPSRPNLLYNGYRVFPGGTSAGAWRWPSTSSSSEVEERVELYHCSPSGPSWPILWWTLPFTWWWGQQWRLRMHRIQLAVIFCRLYYCIWWLISRYATCSAEMYQSVRLMFTRLWLQ